MAVTGVSTVRRFYCVANRILLTQTTWAGRRETLVHRVFHSELFGSVPGTGVRGGGDYSLYWSIVLRPKGVPFLG